MVSTRSGGTSASQPKDDLSTGKKRSSSHSTATKPAVKKAKKDEADANDGKLEVGDNGEVGLAGGHKGNDGKTDEEKGKEGGVGDAEMKNERGEDETVGYTDEKKKEDGEGGKEDKNIEELVEGEGEQKGKEGVKAEEGEAKKEKSEQQRNEPKEDDGNGNGSSTAKDARQATPPSGGNDEPKHGTLESGHIYFLYRPKIDVQDVEGVDDVSKFHMLLVPKSGEHSSGHYHRIIEVGKKKMPDPGAKRQIIWGLVGSTGTDQSALKPAFGEYSYETKTKGTRHQPAARPAARGHYILHSPRDEAADSPEHNKQRDYKVILAYEITTPPPEDFGRVQEELGLAQKGAVTLTVKDPDSADNVQSNPRAANMPREKKAHFPKHLTELFGNRRWIAPNPVSFLDYQGAEILLMSSAHSLDEILGPDGEKVEADMDKAAEKEKTDIDGALKELGLSKRDVEIEALEGAWA